ncbi:Bug family tripartite tricarboxylate transporter substrate binding protein [Ramlibacter sp.]|uniref:Bug family tripartite tricarboxylate transporter substrate binding protein n=1 Tax=Ramlibacter sp. TaxID=1917967 RepID=UPI003D0E942A
MKPILTRTAALLAALALMSSAALADTFPSKPVRFVVGFSPGGSNDIVARMMAPRLGELLGQQVVVENKPGAGGAIAIQSVLAAVPDGHTVSMCTTGSLSIQPHLGAMPFNPETDLVPVTQIANAPYVLLVNASLPVKNVREFIEYARKNPGKVNFASSGNATGGHLAGEMFKALAGVNLVHVPYKGTSQAMTDLLSGQVQAIFDQPISSFQYVRSGQLRPLGVASMRRLAAYPDLPTIHEAGLPNVDPVTWTGVCAAKNTPPEAVARLQRDIARVIQMPEISRKLVADGLEPVGSTAEEFRKFLVADKAKWGRVIKQANVRAE